MFKITSDSLNTSIRPSDSAGAEVVFTGLVRNHNEGRQVDALEYEAFEGLAIPEGEAIIAEAKQLFDIEHLECIHRVGKLNIGDIAVRVVASSAHRRASFDACQYVINEVKDRVPIWKRELYTSGESEWVNATTNSVEEGALSTTEIKLYDRQIRISEIGLKGQQILKESRVLVVGAGGLGCSALQALVAAGVGTVGICDFDVVDISNLHRQPLYDRTDVGRPKAHRAAERMRSLNPSVDIRVHDVRLSESNAQDTISDYSLIIDGTDSFEAKFLMNDLAVQMAKVLVQASIYQRDGQIHVYDPSAPDACLRCLWPITPAEGCVGSCAEVGVLGAVPAVFGSLQAWEAIRSLIGKPSPLTSHVLFYDLETFEQRLIRRSKDPACPTCGSGAKQVQKAHPAILLESPEAVEDWTLIDLRNSEEQAEEPITRFAYISAPADNFSSTVLEGLSKPALLICSRGVSAVDLAHQVRREGHIEVCSLIGGYRTLHSLARKVSR